MTSQDLRTQLEIVPSWERSPEEGAKAYAAFAMYRDMGYDRSYRAVAERIYHQWTRTRQRNVEAWSKRYHWTERIRDYDNYRDALTRRAQEDEAIEQARRIERQRAAHIDAEIDVTNQAWAKLREALALPLVRKTIQDKSNGTITVIEPARWTYGNLASLTLAASKIGRLALGMETDRQQTAYPDEGSDPVAALKSYGITEEMARAFVELATGDPDRDTDTDEDGTASVL